MINKSLQVRDFSGDCLIYTQVWWGIVFDIKGAQTFRTYYWPKNLRQTISLPAMPSMGPIIWHLPLNESSLKKKKLCTRGFSIATCSIDNHEICILKLYAIDNPAVLSIFSMFKKSWFLSVYLQRKHFFVPALQRQKRSYILVVWLKL